MRRNIKSKLAIAIVLLASIWFLYPTYRLYTLTPEEKLKLEESGKLNKLEDRALHLGLDLLGGMHMVLELDKSGMSEDEARDAIERALEIIRNRVDQFGVREPVIQRQGQDQIVVQLPGVDQARAARLIGQTAQLTFQLVKSNEEFNKILAAIDRKLSEIKGFPAAPETTAVDTTASPLMNLLSGADTAAAQGGEEHPFLSKLSAPYQGAITVEDRFVPFVSRVLADSSIQEVIPPDVQIVWGRDYVTLGGKRYRQIYLLKKQPELTGASISNAIVRIGSDLDLEAPNRPYVALDLNPSAARRFADITGANVGKRLAIVLDGVLQSDPQIRERIPGGRCRITLGNASVDEARDLAIVLRAGALPAPLKIIEQRSVGPALGQDSIRRGLRAMLLGFMLVIIFMVIYYKKSGLIANLALIFNLVLLMAAMAGVGATLTLPGIAGIILTIGMAVDANVLIFERIKEELTSGKTVRAAIDAGYSRAFRTIFDANVTTLVTAVVLLHFGTGPIKGFAITLSFGIIASMFTAIIVTRVVFDALAKRRWARQVSI